MKIPSQLRRKSPILLITGLGGMVNVVHLGSAQIWQETTAASLPWRTVAASADFTKLVAAGWGCSGCGDPLTATGKPLPIYTSTNSGTTWIQTYSPITYWASTASSADGVKLVAATAGNSFDYMFSSPDGPGNIYTSSDSGLTWTLTSAPPNSWSEVISSADGVKLFALASGWSNRLYASSDSGATWSQATLPPNSRFISLAASADGMKLLAADNGEGDGKIYFSTDAGTSWLLTGAPSNYWSTVASSANGMKLAATATVVPGFGGDGLIYVSTNAGLTWTHSLPPPVDGGWASLSCSADGSVLAAATSVDWGAWIVTSTDSGTTWTDYIEPLGDRFVFAVAADGHRILAADQDAGIIYSLQLPFSPAPPGWLPQIALNRNGADVKVSWVVPSMSFTLQQSSDLDGTDWTDVVTTPSLNFSNLHYEVAIPPFLRNAFFRLAQH